MYRKQSPDVRQVIEHLVGRPVGGIWPVLESSTAGNIIPNIVHQTFTFDYEGHQWPEIRYQTPWEGEKCSRALVVPKGVIAALEFLRAQFCRGSPYGILFSTHKEMPGQIWGGGRGNWQRFSRETLTWLCRAQEISRSK